MTTPNQYKRGHGTEVVFGPMRTARDVFAALSLLELDGINLNNYYPNIAIDDNKLTVYPKEIQ